MVYKVSEHLATSVWSHIRSGTVCLCRFVRTSEHGTKNRDNILCSISKIVSRHLFYDIASILWWSYIADYYIHMVETARRRLIVVGWRQSSGRPSTAVHDENVTKTRAMSLKQSHHTLRSMVKELYIGKDAVCTILIEKIKIGNVESDANSWTLAWQRSSPYSNNFNALLRRESNH